MAGPNNFILTSLLLAFATLFETAVAQSSQPPTTTATTAVQATASATSIPACATSCLNQAIGTDGQCSASDLTCLCQQATSIQSALVTCLKSSTCSPDDQDSLAHYYPQLCASQNPATQVAVGAVSTGAGSPAVAYATTDFSFIMSATSSLSSGLSQATSTAQDSNNSASSSSNNINNQAMSLPAILGITLAVTVTIGALAGLMLYGYRRRRQLRMQQGSLADDESTSSKPRPIRATTNSKFLVKPSSRKNRDKDELDMAALSRQSTLVAPAAAPMPTSSHIDKPLPHTRCSILDKDNAWPLPSPGINSARQRAWDILTMGRDSWLRIGSSRRSNKLPPTPSPQPLSSKEESGTFDATNRV